MEAGFAVFLVQALAVAAAVWLSSRQALLSRKLPYVVSFAVGVLLATALLHLLPEAVETLGNGQALWACFAGTIFAMFCVERVFAAATGQALEASAESPSAALPIHTHHGSRPVSLVVGGALHSFVDGVSLAAAFAAGRRVGWLTAVAILLHEIPHRMGDFALLLHLQLPRRRALCLVLLIAAAALLGVVMVAVAGHTLHAAAWLLPVSAGSFVYIALVSLLPELAAALPLRNTCWQLGCMLLGAGTVALLLRIPNE